MDAFLKFLTSYVHLDPEEITYIAKLLEPVVFEKNTLILKQGQIEKHLSFIEKGAARYFYTDSDGKEISLLFTFENWFLGEVSSFLTQTVSLSSIETISATKLWRINHKNLQKVFDNTKNGNRFGRLMMQEIYIRKSERERSFLTQSPEQRYLDLMKCNAHIVQQVQLKHIASYLGITPQALSRIRRRIN